MSSETSFEGISSHSLEVVGFGIFTLLASVVVVAFSWHYLNYSGKGPVQGETNTVIAAYALSVIGACSTILQSLIVHFLSGELLWVEALFWSSLVRLILSAPFMFIDSSRFAARAVGEENTPLIPKKEDSNEDDQNAWLHRYRMLALRGLMGTYGGHFALYWGVQFLFPSEAAALWSTAPFFALLFGYLILGEILSSATIVLICVSFVGVLLVIQPIELIAWTWTGDISLVCSTRQTNSFIRHRV